MDAFITNAPSSTKNMDKRRDPEMHQARKGKQWYFGMKADIGIDSKTKIVHSVVATAENVQDSQVLEDLLHGEKTLIWDDSSYTGQNKCCMRRMPENLRSTRAVATMHNQIRSGHATVINLEYGQNYNASFMS